MDTAEYETNTLLLDDIATISFRLYALPDGATGNATSSLLELEDKLREQKHLVSYDFNRHALWYFKITTKSEPTVEADTFDLEPSLEAGGYTLVKEEEGVFDPISLQRPRQPPNTSQAAVNSAAVLADANQKGSAATPQSTTSSSQDTSVKHQNAITKPSNNLTGEVRFDVLSPKAVYENFISTVLLAIIPPLISRIGALPLDYRTILFPPETGIDDRKTNDTSLVVGTFRAYLTTAGALLISFGLSACDGLTLLENTASHGRSQSQIPVLAAPFGLRASIPTNSVDSSSIGVGPSSNIQALSIRAAQRDPTPVWKKACARILRQRGVISSYIGDSSWFNLTVPFKGSLEASNENQRLGSTVATAPWPGNLCFRKKPINSLNASRLSENTLSGRIEDHDPLSDAIAWYNAATDREEKIAKRKAERHIQPMKDVSIEPRSQKLNNLRRSSLVQAAGANSIYPTPPDGIQNPNNWVTPSGDGTFSSPANPSSVPAMVDVDTIPPQPGTVEEPAGDGIDFQANKRESSDTNALEDGDSSMFDAMSGDIFGENDVTEADFSFFDEQPNGNEQRPTSGSSAVPAVEEIVESKPPASPDPPEPEPKAQTTPEVKKDEVVVFAKPELRHARSSQVGFSNTKDSRDSRSVSAKRSSSPFNAQTVFKRVKASLLARDTSSDLGSKEWNRKAKLFDKVSFEADMPLIDKKYQYGGQFDFSKMTMNGLRDKDSDRLLQSELARTHGNGKGFQDAMMRNGGLSRTSSKVEAGRTTATLSRPIGFVSDEDESDADSDNGITSPVSHQPGSPIKSTTRAGYLEDDMMSQAVSLKDLEAWEEPDERLVLEMPKLSEYSYSKSPLWKQFADRTPLSQDFNLSDVDYVQVAQVLTEQASTGLLDLITSKRPSLSRNQSYNVAMKLRLTMPILKNVVSEALGRSSMLSMKELLEVQDVQVPGQPNRLQSRPLPGRDPNAEPLRPNSIYQIPGPHLEVGRAEAKLSILPSAVAFWESLGLAPSSGGKDVRAISVFPDWRGLGDNVRIYLDRMKSVYESLKLGNFETLKRPLESEEAKEEGCLFPYTVDRISTSPDTIMTGTASALMSAMEQLQSALENSELVDMNVVLFFVYSPDDPGTIVEACTAFQRLFDGYKQKLGKKSEPARVELVLQLVSERLISLPKMLVVTSSSDLIRLSLETYDRCAVFDSVLPAPAIRLEQVLPRIIDFKLSTNPSASLIHENSCIHVAYSRSVDERWIAAAWTDDRGSQQATAAYCLGKSGKPLSTSFSDVALEIWETTLDIISVWKVQWRVIITKCSPMDQQEIDFWSGLARTEDKATVNMILLSVDARPSLQLIPPAVILTPTAVAFQATPVSTPQANIVSPEQTVKSPATPIREAATAMATPSAEGDNDNVDTTLIDVTDLTWGAVTSHRLSNSDSILEVNQALSSGYLIKKSGPKIEDILAVMEVNLLHTETPPRSYEPLLREMLGQFRSLGTLTKVRGMADPDGDVRPWHVAAAEKAVRALYLLM